MNARRYGYLVASETPCFRSSPAIFDLLFEVVKLVFPIHSVLCMVRLVQFPDIFMLTLYYSDKRNAPIIGQLLWKRR